MATQEKTIVGSAKYQRRNPGVNYEAPKMRIDTCKAPKCDKHGTVLIDGHCAVCISNNHSKAPSWWTYPDFVPETLKGKK